MVRRGRDVTTPGARRFYAKFNNEYVEYRKRPLQIMSENGRERPYKCVRGDRVTLDNHAVLRFSYGNDDRYSAVPTSRHDRPPFRNYTTRGPLTNFARHGTRYPPAVPTYSPPVSR